MTEQTSAPAPVIPWWKSRGVLWGLAGVLVAVSDGAHAWLTGGELTWRTGAILIGGALATYFRKNATGFVAALLLGKLPSDDASKGGA